MNSLSQSQMQKMLQRLSPQQIQMIKLLELPTIQLEQRIKNEIEENPALEEITENPEEESKQINIDEYAKREEIPSYKLYINNTSKDDKIISMPLSDSLTLTEHLNEQLSYFVLDEKIEIIARYIIGSLDRDGYLRRELESIGNDLAFTMGLDVSEGDVEMALKQVQLLEPRGIGARDLREALLIQLQYLPRTKNVQIAEKIIEQHFESFAKRHFDKIAQRLSIDEIRLREVISVIVNLSPKPANLYNEYLQSEPTIQITPDFVLDVNEEELDLSLNRYNSPDIKISQNYLDLLENLVKQTKKADKLEKSRNSSDKEAAMFIKQKIDSARWFISAIKQRNTTLLVTMNAIMNLQRSYFISGDERDLKPMILKDIAERTGLDVSTISRVVNSKYIQTPFGMFPLKYFFSEAMMNSEGEEVSSREIKSILSRCVESENKQEPLTDEALMIILQEKGYKIARRTVAKYREMLDIPVARMRREY